MECVKNYCNGKMEEHTNQYGGYWICQKCKNIISKKCHKCGGEMRLVTINGSSAAKCSKCGALNYGHK